MLLQLAHPGTADRIFWGAIPAHGLDWKTNHVQSLPDSQQPYRSSD